MTHHEDAKRDITTYLRGMVDRTIDKMAKGTVQPQKTRNPFTGEETTLRAKPVFPPLVELHKRLAGADGAIPPRDRDLLRLVFAYVALEAVGGLAASAAGEGEMFGELDLQVLDGAGEQVLDGVYAIIPTPEEVASQ